MIYYVDISFLPGLQKYVSRESYLPNYLGTYMTSDMKIESFAAWAKSDMVYLTSDRLAIPFAEILFLRIKDGTSDKQKLTISVPTSPADYQRNIDKFIKAWMNEPAVVFTTEEDLAKCIKASNEVSVSEVTAEVVSMPIGKVARVSDCDKVSYYKLKNDAKVYNFVPSFKTEIIQDNGCRFVGTFPVEKEIIVSDEEWRSMVDTVLLMAEAESSFGNLVKEE